MDSIQQDEFGKFVAEKISDADSALCLIISARKNGDGSNDITIERAELNFSTEIAAIIVMSVASAIKKLFKFTSIHAPLGFSFLRISKE